MPNCKCKLLVPVRTFLRDLSHGSGNFEAARCIAGDSFNVLKVATWRGLAAHAVAQHEELVR